LQFIKNDSCFFNQEFKLNPNAKSFTPSASLRPPHPTSSDASYYYPNNMPAAPLGPGLPVGMGVSLCISVSFSCLFFESLYEIGGT